MVWGLQFQTVFRNTAIHILYQINFILLQRVVTNTVVKATKMMKTRGVTVTLATVVGRLGDTTMMRVCVEYVRYLRWLVKCLPILELHYVRNRPMLNIGSYSVATWYFFKSIILFFENRPNYIFFILLYFFFVLCTLNRRFDTFFFAENFARAFGARFTINGRYNGNNAAVS